MICNPEAWFPGTCLCWTSPWSCQTWVCDSLQTRTTSTTVSAADLVLHWDWSILEYWAVIGQNKEILSCDWSKFKCWALIGQILDTEPWLVKIKNSELWLARIKRYWAVIGQNKDIFVYYWLVYLAHPLGLNNVCQDSRAIFRIGAFLSKWNIALVTQVPTSRLLSASNLSPSETCQKKYVFTMRWDLRKILLK